MIILPNNCNKVFTSISSAFKRMLVSNIDKNKELTDTTVLFNNFGINVS